jgi:hypothetical protein
MAEQDFTPPLAPAHQEQAMKPAKPRPKKLGARLVAIDATPLELTRLEVRLLAGFRKASPMLKQMVIDMIEDHNVRHPHRSVPSLRLISGGTA